MKKKVCCLGMDKPHHHTTLTRPTLTYSPPPQAARGAGFQDGREEPPNMYAPQGKQASTTNEGLAL